MIHMDIYANGPLPIMPESEEILPVAYSQGFAHRISIVIVRAQADATVVATLDNPSSIQIVEQITTRDIED